jgi:hypothetical protein
MRVPKAEKKIGEEDNWARKSYDLWALPNIQAIGSMRIK